MLLYSENYRRGDPEIFISPITANFYVSTRMSQYFGASQGLKFDKRRLKLAIPVESICFLPIHPWKPKNIIYQGSGQLDTL